MFGTEDPLDDHLELVRIVSGADVAPPAEWQSLHDRLRSFLELGNPDRIPLRDQLTDAIIGGADASLAVMRSLALGEIPNQAQVTTLTTHVRNAVHQRLRELYDGAAAYAQVAEKFNRAATDFTAAAQLADPETDPTEMVTQPDKPRKAWHISESHANQLSRLIDPLAAAAALAGIPDTDSDTIRLPLCVNVDGHHRRQLWTAWSKSDGRCHRWSALHQLGVTIRAANLDGGLESYREPKVMETRDELIRDENGRVVATKRVPHDPEDDGALPAIDPRRPQGRSVAV